MMNNQEKFYDRQIKLIIEKSLHLRRKMKKFSARKRLFWYFREKALNLYRDKYKWNFKSLDECDKAFEYEYPRLHIWEQNLITWSYTAYMKK